MELEIPLLALQTALAASVVTAWSIAAGNVHFDPIPTEPETLPTGVTSALPAAWIQLVSLTPSYDASNARAARDASHSVTFDIAGVFALPVIGTVQATKIAKLQDLLDVLTVATDYRYGGYPYRVGEIDFESPFDSIEETYSVRIQFSVEVITDG